MPYGYDYYDWRGDEQDLDDKYFECWVCMSRILSQHGRPFLLQSGTDWYLTQ
jgi:hypothetical protein